MLINLLNTTFRTSPKRAMEQLLSTLGANSSGIKRHGHVVDNIITLFST